MSETDTTLPAVLKPRPWILILLAVLALLAFAVARVPAHWALAQAAARIPLRVAATQGTLWQGSATELELYGLRVDKLDWELSPWGLFAGRLSGHLDARLPEGFVRGKISVDSGGQLDARQLQAALPAKAVADAVPAARNLVTGGQLTAKLDRLTLGPQGIQAASGQLGLSDLETAYGSGKMGSYQAEVKTAPDGAITGSAHDIDGPVALQATLRLSNGRQYQVSGSLAGKGERGKDIEQALRFLGKADSGGRHHFRFNGSIPLPKL